MPLVPVFSDPVRAELLRLSASILELARAFPAAAPRLEQAADLLTVSAALCEDRRP